MRLSSSMKSRLVVKRALFKKKPTDIYNSLASSARWLQTTAVIVTEIPRVRQTGLSRRHLGLSRRGKNCKLTTYKKCSTYIILNGLSSYLPNQNFIRARIACSAGPIEQG